METTQRIDLSLQLEPNGGVDSDTREQLTEICVMQLGMSVHDTERLFNSQGPFLVSTPSRARELSSAIAELEALGVLVRPSSPTLGESLYCPNVINSRVGRARLYSSQFGELLDYPRMRPSSVKSAAPLPFWKQAGARRLALMGAVFVVALTISSFRLPSKEGLASDWRTDEEVSTSAASSIIAAPDESLMTFHGSATTGGIQFTLKVSKSGDNFSARLNGAITHADSHRSRIEGEPVFLQGADNQLTASTPISVSDHNRIYSSGTAHITITRDAEGTPRVARIVIDPTTSILPVEQQGDNTLSVSIELLSR